MTGFNLDKVDPLALSRSFPVVDDGKGNLTIQGEPVYLIDAFPQYRISKGSKACGFYGGKPVFKAWCFYRPSMYVPSSGHYGDPDDDGGFWGDLCDANWANY